MTGSFSGAVSRRALLAALGMLSLSACAPGVATSATPKPAESAPSTPTAPSTAAPVAPTAAAATTTRTTKVVWSNWAVDAGSKDRLAEQKDGFEAARRSVALDIQNTPSAEYMTKLLATYAADQAPDVSRLNTEQLPIFAARGQTSDLDVLSTPAADSWLKRADIKPGLVDRYRLAGKLAGLPYGGDMDALYVNRTLLGATNQSVPPSDYEDATWTYDRALALAQALTKRRADGGADQLGIDIGGYRYEGHVENAGGSWFSIDGRSFRGHEPGAAAGIDWLAALVRKHKVAAAPATDESRAFAFASGKLAMSWSSVSQVSNRLRDVADRFDWDVYPVPRWGTNPRVVKSGFSALILSARSKQRDAAWDFLHWVTGPVGSLPDVETGWSVPVFSGLDSRYFVRVGPKKNLSVALNGPKYPSKFPMWTNPNYAEAWRRVQTAIEQVFQGAGTAADVLGGIRAEVDAMLAKS
ncbi:MAG: extracellular solute-binding protein [Chloroflexota bacterium]|nr:MAG: extracellular solute-binding protein [Chloroflexota bacterium]